MMRTAGLAAALLLTMSGAAAEARIPVALSSQVFVERTERDLNGQRRRILQPASQIGQGDNLIFVVRYRNQGNDPVSGFVVTNAVPSTVRIQAAEQNGMQVSVDGGASWGRLETLIVKTPLGGTRRATPEDITHVRWMMRSAIRPGETGQIAYRGVVR
jgi:uncharacterized repeat protein (TIGR01451 family)